jgi:VanZ family protein
MNRNVILSWTAVVLWLVLIFYLSSQPAEESNGLSKSVTKIIVETVEKIVDVKEDINMVDRFNHLVRKYAHFMSYLILGILVNNALVVSNVNKTFKYSLLFCIVYAISDEFHQLFVPGRGAQISDVIIDSFGAFFGIWFYEMISKFKKVIVSN